MKKISKLIIYAAFFSTIISCSSAEKAIHNNGRTTSWDFDHNLQYKKTQFNENNYQLEIIPNSKVNFERLSAFLLRRGYLICGTYPYKMELIAGVEGFDYARASPNFIMPNLTAKLECLIKK